MEQLSDLFWNASIAELQQGYIYCEHSQEYTCLICGHRSIKGIVYADGATYYEAEKYMQLHIYREHSSTFSYLLSLDKKVTGLTDHQKMLLTHFYEGRTDADIVRETGSGSTSTIRNHRFTLREKEKQAKVFLAIMGMVTAKPAQQPSFITIHKTATMVDERYAMTEEENEKILRAYFPEGLAGPLSEFPGKEKRKIAVLRHIIKRFDPNCRYSEKEVNAILKKIHSDYVTLRRYLIEYGFMDRITDGSQYWVML